MSHSFNYLNKNVKFRKNHNCDLVISLKRALGMSIVYVNIV